MVIKRIDKKELKIGMFVEAVEGPWRDDPAMGRRFVVKTAEQLAAIVNGNVSGVFINTALGRPGDGSDASVSERKTLRNATRQEKLQIAQTINHQAEEARGLIQDVFDGQDVSVATFAPLSDDIGRTMDENPSLFIGMSRLRSLDTATFVHSLSVAALLVHFARSLEMDEAIVQPLCVAGLLHDVGKLAIPKQVLHKQGPLSPEERLRIEQHPELGYKVLQKQLDMPELVLDICRSHHERLDGKGYPQGLLGAQISPEVRMSTICDVFDALTSARSYKKGWSSHQALSWMMDREDQFDRTLLRRFILSLDTEMTKGLL